MDGGQGVVAGPGWQESVVPQSSVSGLLVQPVGRNSLRLPVNAVGPFLSFGPETCCLVQ